MSSQRRMPRSIAKYIRKEKARIRRTVPDPKEREQMLKTLYAQFAPFIKRNE